MDCNLCNLMLDSLFLLITIKSQMAKRDNEKERMNLQNLQTRFSVLEII